MTTPPPSLFVNASAVPWVERRPGVFWKTLWEDADGRHKAILMRYEPGATVPRHLHVGDEQIYVLEGSVADDTGVCTAGNYARRLGLDLPRFTECLDAARFRDAVAADQREGRAAGVRATPTFFVNGEKIEGALPAALAARCAGAQGRFWEYHDLLFVAQPDFSRDELLGYARRLGLDTPPFTECLDSARFRDAVLADQREGLDAGVGGTPTFFINGRKIEGALPLEEFREAIRQALREAAAPSR